MSDAIPTPKTAPDLDAMLTQKECATWLGIKPARLKALSAGGASAVIPCFSIGPREPRYHVRSVLAGLARRNGVPAALIHLSISPVSPQPPKH